MAARNITKRLGGEEDLLLGEGSEVQSRFNGDQTLNKVNLAKWVVNATALTALDTDSFVRARLGTSNIPYRWASLDTQTPDADFVIAGTDGNWLKVVEQPILRDYAESTNVNLTATGVVTLNLNNGNVHEATLTGNVTFAFSNSPPTAHVGNLTLIVSQDATGGRTVTWPASVVWAGGTAPTLITSANAISVLTFFTTNGGTTWYGFLSGDDMS